MTARKVTHGFVCRSISTVISVTSAPRSPGVAPYGDAYGGAS